MRQFEADEYLAPHLGPPQLPVVAWPEPFEEAEPPAGPCRGAVLDRGAGSDGVMWCP